MKATRSVARRRLAARDAAERAPDAERALAGRVGFGVVGSKVAAAVNRIRDEADGAVDAKRVDSARVVARRAVVTAVMLRVSADVEVAVRGVRRQDRVEAHDVVASVAVAVAANFGPERIIVRSDDRSVVLVDLGKAAVRRALISDDGALTFFVSAV